MQPHLPQRIRKRRLARPSERFRLIRLLAASLAGVSQRMRTKLMRIRGCQSTYSPPRKNIYFKEGKLVDATKALIKQASMQHPSISIVCAALVVEPLSTTADGA